MGGGATYLPVAADKGGVLSCTLTATSAAGAASGTTASVVVTRQDSIRDRYAELNGGLPCTSIRTGPT